MSWAAWLAAAVAALVFAAPAAAPVRVDALTDLGRLASVASGPAGGEARQRVRGVRRAGARPAGACLTGVGLPAVAAGAAVVAVVVVVVLVGGGALAVALAAVGGAGWLLSRDAVRRRTALRRHAELLRALRVLIGELAAGGRPAAALGAAADTGGSHATVFAAAAAAAERAADAGSVLAGHRETRAIGLAWRLGEDLGAELAGVLGRVARDLGAADEQRRGVAVALAGPRASAALVTGLPLFGLTLGVALGARPERFLLGAPAGRLVCCAGVLLDVAGVLWMRRILRRAEQP